MERLRELTMVAAIVLGVITCAPQEVEGGIARHVGVWCHGASTAPHYFHSRMATIVLDPRSEEWELGTGVGRRLLERALKHVETEFVRYVTGRYGSERLLFPRCELLDSFVANSSAVSRRVEGARYARGGVLWTYGENEKTEVDWTPSLENALRSEGDGSAGHLFVECHGCPVMTVVPGGSFVMGSPVKEAGRRYSEGPLRTVTIARPFAVGVYEVTFAEWDECARRGGCRGYYPVDQGWGRGRRPVIHVAWEDAQAYVAWLSSVTGEEYRLLSEAEWEYVARAGTTTSRYWGDDEMAQCRFANGSDESARWSRTIPDDVLGELNSRPERRDVDDVLDERNMRRAEPRDGCRDLAAVTNEVGRYEPNAFGLYDVLGNVWELTADCLHVNYAGGPTDGRVWEGGDCDHHIMRGGGHYSHRASLRAARRGTARTGFNFETNSGPRDFFDRGFRVARVIGEPPSGDGR